MPITMATCEINNRYLSTFRLSMKSIKIKKPRLLPYIYLKEEKIHKMP